MSLMIDRFTVIQCLDNIVQHYLCPPWPRLWCVQWRSHCAQKTYKWYSHQVMFQSLSPLIQMSSSAWRDAILLCPLTYFISVSVSPPCSLLLILSHSYGGRDENGCLIMQRGQPIKGPGLSDLKAYSEHSWREQEREGDTERERDGLGFDCCMARRSHLIHLPLVLFQQ